MAKIVVIGTGLIGTSLGLALRQSDPAQPRGGGHGLRRQRPKRRPEAGRVPQGGRPHPAGHRGSRRGGAGNPGDGHARPDGDHRPAFAGRHGDNRRRQFQASRGRVGGRASAGPCPIRGRTPHGGAGNRRAGKRRTPGPGCSPANPTASSPTPIPRSRPSPPLPPWPRPSGPSRSSSARRNTTALSLPSATCPS